MAEARIPNHRGDIVVLNTELVFRAFLAGDSMVNIAESYSVHKWQIEELIRAECIRRDEGRG